VALTSMLLGWLIALQVTRRLERLTEAAGEVASTGRLDVDVPVDGSDETGQLGRAFSGMLDALQRSKQEQQQLVQDAGHELRTPLTSLRTNVSVLRRRFDHLTPDARDQLLGDLDSETRELTDLVNELVELATDRRDDELVQPVRLADVAERAAARARRRFSREVAVEADETVIDGRPNALERALQNLVDNACKFAPDGAVEVRIAGGTVTVRDHGPGLVPADVPHLFDRFFRSVQMRSKPGSGLGLAIVKSIVEGHGGTVFARNADGGGAILGFTLPVPTSG
jgi:two-component system sensor histidine kinase MprB